MKLSGCRLGYGDTKMQVAQAAREITQVPRGGGSPGPRSSLELHGGVADSPTPGMTEEPEKGPGQMHVGH